MGLKNVFVSVLVACLAACGGGGSSPAPSPPPPAPDPFIAVDTAAQAAFTAQGISGMGLAIYDAQGVKRFEKMYGTFAADQRVAIASSSKMVAGLTILRLVDQGFLSMDSTTGSVLGWTGPQAAITLEQLLSFTSGHGEGWALYAERLMRELGHFGDDGNLLGLLDSQLFRTARVILDIGMHLQLEIPAGAGFHDGERWTPELGLEFLLTRTLTTEPFAGDEIDRYLGWPGQAPAYKLGEQTWLRGRADAEARHGARFDLKAFHTNALLQGSMGLDPLVDMLATL